MENASKREKFNKILMESISEALSILGKPTRDVLLSFLKQNYFTEDVEDPKILISCIRRFFGEAGGAFLESRIIEALYRKLGASAPPFLSFEDALKNAMKIYLKPIERSERC